MRVCVHRCVSVCVYGVYTRNVCEKHWRSGRELMCSCDHYSGFSQCWYKSINQRWLELNHTHVFIYWISKRSYNEQKNVWSGLYNKTQQWFRVIAYSTIFMFLKSLMLTSLHLFDTNTSDILKHHNYVFFIYFFFIHSSDKSWIFSVITPVFSVTRSFRNHTNMPICCSINIYDNYQCWKQLCCFIF